MACLLVFMLCVSPMARASGSQATDDGAESIRLQTERAMQALVDAAKPAGNDRARRGDAAHEPHTDDVVDTGTCQDPTGARCGAGSAGEAAAETRAALCFDLADRCMQKDTVLSLCLGDDDDSNDCECARCLCMHALKIIASRMLVSTRSART